MDNELRQRLVRLAVEKSFKYSEQETFRLASGKMSNYYIDCRKITHNPEGKFLIGTVIFEMIKQDGITAVGGLTMGADPIANAVSLISYMNKENIGSFSIRKERKQHGLKKMVEGATAPGDRVLIVEDVVTTGGSTVRAIASAREEGLNVVRVIALVDREEGGAAEILKQVSRLDCLLTKTELIEAYKAMDPRR